MQDTTLVTNLVSIFQTELENYLKIFKNSLESGNLYEFEGHLTDLSHLLYDKMCQSILQEALDSAKFEASIRHLAKQKQMGKLKKRAVNLQIKTGSYITLNTYYARKCKDNHSGSRYVGFLLWGVIQNASPHYYSQASMFAVLCGSYQIAKQVFDSLKIRNNLARIRDLSLSVSRKCLANRPAIMLSKTDDLSGKRVIISIDGGRCRTRVYKEETNVSKTHHKFDTPWREPKLFVITIIGQDGKIDKKEFPIFDNAFGESALFDLLKKYLKALNISQVEQVQCVADGALWIWNHLKDLLKDLQVSDEKIVETVDYYHAVEHLKSMVDALPKHIKEKNNKLFDTLKGYLWAGEIDKIKEKIAEIVKKTSKKIKTELKYFAKNQHRMNYENFRNQKLLCGSGIIESGIRRMINLRFKCPSSFWKIENLEGLIFLRCALLSKRWNIIVHNLTTTL